MPRTDLTERDFQHQVVELARIHGWRIHHARRYDKSIAGDPGFPDLVLAKDGQVVFAELKTETGKPTAAQTAWLDALAGGWPPTAHAFIAQRVTVCVWRPSELAVIQKVLSARSRT